jgi:outer membrane receptor protein involved in Fe transport
LLVILKPKTTFMRKTFAYLIVLTIVSIFSSSAFSQITIVSGNVKNSSSGEEVSAVSIIVKGSGTGTFTDGKGNFKLNVNKSLPLTLVISSIGYELQEVQVNNSSDFVQVNFKPASALGQEVVIAATRTPSRIMESPVTIERISGATIRNSASPSYYDIVGNLKGVDVVTASLNFKTPSTRGFNGSGNLRLNQIVDGMDNQAPGLNFSLGSVIGLTELDVESVELLPGASSALYGPGGMNGALLINSKNPFKYQGLSFQVKTGVMHIDNRERPASPYYNWSLRWAQKISDKFAFKLGGEFIQAKDWVADDNRNYNRLAGTVLPGTRNTDPAYNGVNVYGDEGAYDIKPILNGIAAQVPFYAPYISGLPAAIPVSRTGYLEKEVVDPNTVNIKLSGAIDYKVSGNTDLLLSGYWGTGNTVYTGSDRYSLKDLKMGQYKIELNNPNWFLRGYTTQENAGQAFSVSSTIGYFNEAWKKTITFTNGVPTPLASDWLIQYSAAFLQSKLGGQSDITAHNSARAFADEGRPLPGSDQFRQIFDNVRSTPISKNGGLFVDRTNLYSAEGQYNFSQWTSKLADIIVGANYKRYVLNSEGTIFADSAAKIGINEYGAYVQATRRLLNDRLKLILSGRFDKNENFTGKFTPRISAVIKIGQDNFIRLSYQSAYRFGSTQQQWINLKISSSPRLLGGLKTFQDYYKFNSNPVYSVDESLFAGKPQVRNFNKFKAETVNSFEVGYKELVLNKKLLVDAYGYYGINNDFIARTVVAQSVNGNIDVFQDTATVKANLADPTKVTVYSVPTNVDSKVKTYGFGLGLDYTLPHNFFVNANFSSDKLSDVPVNFQAQFNAPLYRVGASLSNTGFGCNKRFGFNVGWRWQDKVDYTGDFASGEIPAYHSVDGQVSYKFPVQKILLKLGGTNLLNQYYRNGFGNASVGGLYYFSVGYNLF